MKWLRSLAFNTFFYTWLVLFLLTAWVLLPFSHHVMAAAIRRWERGVVWALKWLAGVDARVEGLENLPNGPCVVASKHQSTWETFSLYGILPYPCYVLKQELMRIPFWGWYATKTGHIAVDRSAGARALKDMVAQVKTKIGENRQIVIFPEGTRTAPGEQRRYHPGVAAIYKALPDGVPIIPVALNSGVHWGRRRFTIEPGTITARFLPAIPPGLERKEFMRTLETQIEGASRALLESPDKIPS